MTQRKWTTTDGWDVLTGWDRPLQHFFVTIDRECIHCDSAGEAPEVGEYPCTYCHGEGTEYLFNNLDENPYTDFMGGMTMTQLRQVLNLKLTDYPRGVIPDLLGDMANNVGNLIHVYDTCGEEKK